MPGCFVAPTTTLPSTLVTLEQQGGVWVAVAEATLREDIGRATAALALRPQSGDLGAVAGHQPLAGTEEFASTISAARRVAGPSPRPSRSPTRSISGPARQMKQLLAFTPDGRQLYTNFAGEPLALLEVDPADGSLELGGGRGRPR